MVEITQDGCALKIDVSRRIPGTVPRLGAPQGVVWHATGGLGSNGVLYQVLRARKLSVNYGIAKDGSISEFVPPEHMTSHASTPKFKTPTGAFRSYPNQHFISVEIGFPLFPSGAWLREPEDWAEYTAVISRTRTKLVKLQKAQLASIVELADYLSDRFDIPRQVPQNPDGSVRTQRMSLAELRAFRGHCGHLHMSGTSKVDPGPEPFIELHHAWTP